MVNNVEKQLDSIFNALSDPTRRAMMAQLAKGDCHVSDLPNPYGVSKAAISKHLSVLSKAELVSKQKNGRMTHCRANPESLDPALKLLEELGQFWRERLESLDRYMISDGSENPCNSESGNYIHSGEYLEIVPPEKLVFTWNSHLIKDSKVTITLRELDGSTELTLVHELLGTEEICAQHNQGWNGCIENLQKFLS